MPRLYTEVQQGTIQFFCVFFFLSMKPLHTGTKDFYTPDLTEVKQVNPTNTTTEHTEPVCYYLKLYQMHLEKQIKRSVNYCMRTVLEDQIYRKCLEMWKERFH